MHIHATLSRIKPCDTSVMHASTCVQVTLPPEAKLSQTEATTPGSAPTDVTQRQWHLLSYLPPTTSQQRPNQPSPRLTAACNAQSAQMRFSQREDARAHDASL